MVASRFHTMSNILDSKFQSRFSCITLQTNRGSSKSIFDTHRNAWNTGRTYASEETQRNTELDLRKINCTHFKSVLVQSWTIDPPLYRMGIIAFASRTLIQGARKILFRMSNEWCYYAACRDLIPQMRAKLLQFSLVWINCRNAFEIPNSDWSARVQCPVHSHQSQPRNFLSLYYPLKFSCPVKGLL